MDNKSDNKIEEQLREFVLEEAFMTEDEAELENRDDFIKKSWNEVNSGW